MVSQPLRDTLRKRKNRSDETVEQRENRLAQDKENKRVKRATETAEQREIRLQKRRERYHMKRKERLALSNIEEQLNRQDEPTQDDSDESRLSEADRKLLHEFRTKINSFVNNCCPVCNERFPSIEIISGQCRRCYYDKNTVKKFSADNNMDPGDVPEELRDLTEIEEMLIARIFPIVSVYCLRGGQYAYRGNVINFPQNVEEFATQLPRNPSSLDVLIVRRKSANSLIYKNFTVHRTKVTRALCWLKQNNRYYTDIVIDEEVLQSLPEDGPIDDQLPQIDDVEQHFNDDDDVYEDMIGSNFVPAPLPSPNEEQAIGDTLNRMQDNDLPIMWPSIDGTPINEFQTPGYIACAFPTLYPTGNGDLRSNHVREVKPSEYFSHLLKYKDGRFARHPRWRYFALNSQMRWRALQEAKVYVKQVLDDKQYTVEEIKEMIEKDNHMADRIVRFGEALRGTRQFWTKRRYELADMIRQLGSQGMIFFTFSAADLHWPELHNLMPHGDVEDADRYRRQDLIENPHISAWFFEKRFKLFLEKVLIPKWNLEDYWYRFEWQHRGSPHVHGIGKRKDAPSIDWEKMKEDEDMMNNVVRYLDSLVTTKNPDQDAPVPAQHPCKKCPEELSDDLQDYIELVNKLQRHTRCNPAYCLRVDRAGKNICRFGYPKEITNDTYLRDNKGQPELITARNDEYVNPHDRLQLQGWRANVDLKPILSMNTALQYVSKYASKSEPRSAAFSEILNKILNENAPDASSLPVFQGLLLHTVAERDISAQETCHLLLNIPLYHSSRRFVTLNLNKLTHRWLCGTGDNNEESFLADSEVGQTVQSPLQKYWVRPAELDDVSLFRLHLQYNFWKGQWKPCKKENIVRIWPRPSPQIDGPQWEEFCRVKVLLHVCHRDLSQLTENNTISWSELYYRHREIIENDPVDILGPPVDNLENESNDEDSDYEYEEFDDDEEQRPDWMILSEMRPDAILEGSSELGLREIDRNYDWVGDVRQRYTNIDLADSPNFIQNARNLYVEQNDNVTDRVVDPHTLNEKQKIIFERVESHYQALILNPGNVDALNVIVMGTAGTGKSYLINMIRSRLQEIARNNNITEHSPVLVLAPTGVAAFNIRGITIHSALSIPISNNKLDLNGERLKKLQKKLEGVEYLIIDEKSMVGRRMLALIDMRLRQAFPQKQNKVFGGRSIILVGDFGQLPPVRDEPMYSKISRDTLSNEGIKTYRQFREVYKLDVIQRQSGDSDVQRKFRAILLRMRDGESTLDDWKELTTQFSNGTNITSAEFSDAICIMYRKSDVAEFNVNKLKSLNCPVALIKAIHTGGKEASKADPELAKGLEAQLLLARGARVMLRINLWTEVGLVNGSLGTVQEIIFEENQSPPSLPIAVLIEFDNYYGPAIVTEEGKRLVPVSPIRYSWEGKKVTCSRLQVPICFAWAITIHKSQGLTLQKAVIDIGKKEYAAGQSFVAISRVCALKDILFSPFSFERLQRIKSLKRLEERIEEESRLMTLQNSH
ncbi:ATP-dependent DNA helicase PIF1 [Rhizophagus irregularis DAOM 181602=DAOM 197198]|nr:ATP-dependent DNA helicase PIF1 [Rhizophagus irregularis DAOM 181602=DAOM 197198]